MDKRRISGAADKAKGTIKETAGKVFGNERLRAEGMAGKVKGDVKQRAGEIADKARDVAKKISK